MMLRGRVVSIVRSIQRQAEEVPIVLNANFALLDFQETYFFPFIKFKGATAVPFL